jgi:hypothetical protein
MPLACAPSVTCCPLRDLAESNSTGPTDWKTMFNRQRNAAVVSKGTLAPI